MPATGITPPRELEFNLSASVLEDIKKAENDADMWVDDLSVLSCWAKVKIY